VLLPRTGPGMPGGMATVVVDAAFCAGQNKDGVQNAGRVLARRARTAL